MVAFLPTTASTMWFVCMLGVLVISTSIATTTIAIAAAPKNSIAVEQQQNNRTTTLNFTGTADTVHDEQQQLQQQQTTTKTASGALLAPYNPEWWKTTVIYQIYPRSFADSNGDGVGDLPGITSRLEYITSLGVRAIWISPFYESPQDDMGYDVSNFTRIDPLFGTDRDFALLMDEAHGRNIRVIMDLVPSHTSYRCVWFEKSRNRVGTYSDYYVWHAGNPSRPLTVLVNNNTVTRNGVPNNWASVFGNSMWTWDDVRGEYYLHQFLKEQPDLNYRNPLVRAEMQDIIKFWLDKGVDGIRIDAFAHVYEQEPFLNNDEPLDPKGPGNVDLYESFVHTKTKHQVGNFLLLQEWQKMVRQYEAENNRDHIFLVSEVYGDTIDESMHYDTYNGTKGADFNYNFNLINISSANGYDIESAIKIWLEHLPSNSWPNWVTGNHDKNRTVSRVGENRNLVDGLNMLLLLLPGTPTSYYGEEIGMSNNFNISLAQVRDKNALTPAHLPIWSEFTRDYERTPMQWTCKLPFAGFSPENATFLPWLPVNENAARGISVEAQQNDSSSHLGVYKKLVELRSRTPFVLSKSMQVALVTPTLYSFYRIQSSTANSSQPVSAYLTAVDLRQKGSDIVSYNFAPVMIRDPSSGNFTTGRVVVHSSGSNNSPWFGQNNLITDWSKIDLLPGESFVAELLLDDTELDNNSGIDMSAIKNEASPKAAPQHSSNNAASLAMYGWFYWGFLIFSFMLSYCVPFYSVTCSV